MCIEASSIFLFAFWFMPCSSMCCLWHRSSIRSVIFSERPWTRPSNVPASIVQVLRFRRANSIIVPGKRKGSARPPAFWEE
ncbi:hypothetical protein B0H13DRAFT_1985645, partial [Mycena leptocephala]